MLAYWPGLYGPFMFDDMPNLQPLNRNNGVTSLADALAFIFSNYSGALGRPVSMASFLLSDSAWPGSPFSFKLVNLLIHLINFLLAAYLIFCLSLRAGSSRRFGLVLGFVTALIWALHPFNVSTVLYVVQRMTELSALFTLLAMIFYVVARQRDLQSHSVSSILFLTLSLVSIGLAVLSKENGVLAFFFLLLIEYVFFKNEYMSARYKVLFRLGVLLPVWLFVGYLVISFGAMMADYTYRDFSLYERLLTQARIVLNYLAYIFFIELGGMGLFHDDFAISKGMFEPLSTFISLLVLGMLLALAFVLVRKFPLVSFGVLFFFVGHALESTYLPLELYFEHRNYLPMLGVLMSFVSIVLGLRRVCAGYIGNLLSGLILITVASGAFAMTKQNAQIWADDFQLYTMWATEHPDSLRAQRHYGGYLGRTSKWSVEGMDVLADAFVKFPDSASLPLTMLNLECKYQLESGINLEQVVNNLATLEEDGAISLALAEFSALYIAGKCQHVYSPTQMDALFKALTESKVIPNRAKAEYFAIWADYYRSKGNLSGTIEAFDKAFSLSNNYAIALTQAHILNSAGLYAEALGYIAKAREADAQRKRAWIIPSQQGLIDKLEQHIQTSAQKSNLSEEY